MPVDAFDNHLKIPFVEERLCRLPKNTDEIFPTSFCADAPPLLQVPHRPGLRAFPCGKTQRPPGSCSYWHWGASKLQWRSANTWRLPCLAPRTETQAHACPLPSICVPHSPVGSPSFRARASQDDASRKESFCQPSFNAAGAGNPLWHNYPAPVIQFIPFLHLCQRFSFRLFT